MKDNQLQFDESNSGIAHRRNGYGLLTGEGDSTEIMILQSDINGEPYPAKETARKIVAFWNSYHKNCGPHAVECAESDLLGQFIEALKQVMRCTDDGGYRISFACSSILADGFRRLISQTTEGSNEG